MFLSWAHWFGCTKGLPMQEDNFSNKVLRIEFKDRFNQL